MADAGELVGAAATSIAVSAQVASLQPTDVVVVAAVGLGTENSHDGPPFASVRLDAVLKKVVRNQMCGLVRHGLREEIVPVAHEQLNIVANDT